MYNDTIKVANKIISSEDLYEIFSAMNEKLVYYKKISTNEEMHNRMLEYGYQKWTFKDSGSSLKFNVDFYDDTRIAFDNYNNFITVFNNRLHEIKDIGLTFHLDYSATNNEGKSEYYSQRIYMEIRETRMDIDVSLLSDDKKIDDVYELIKNKVLNAPVKYDNLIRKRTTIYIIVGAAMAFIPALVICGLALLIPDIRQLFATTYVLLPICCLLLVALLTNSLSIFKLDKLYKNIIPERKYMGYDFNSGTSKYKDDVASYTETSEILIGKNVDNKKRRENILKIYEKYKNFLPFEIGILLMLSVLAIFLGNL